MKKLFLELVFLLSALSFSSAFINTPLAFNLSNLISNRVCSQPLTYKIGTVDPQFNISNHDFQSDAQSAADLWNNNSGRTLLKYSPNGTVTVNLIYDFRQSIDDRINTLENQLQVESNTISESNNEYQKENTEYQSELAALNMQIDYWNRQGGAPADIYSQLKDKQNELNSRINTLNGISQRLNEEIQKYNSQVDQHQRAVNQFNYVLNVKPEAGIYEEKSNEINIYFGRNQDELVHTLAHEMGHAIGLGHSRDASSIMYPYSNDNTVLSQSDIQSLKGLCNQ